MNAKKTEDLIAKKTEALEIQLRKHWAAVEKLARQLGYVSELKCDGYVEYGLFPPDISLAEKVDALCKHLNLDFKRTDVVPSKVEVVAWNSDGTRKKP